MGLAFLCSAKYKECVATVRPRDMPSLGVSSLDFPGRFLAAFFLPFELDYPIPASKARILPGLDLIFP
jgi:hypothetical protein